MSQKNLDWVSIDGAPYGVPLLLKAPGDWTDATGKARYWVGEKRRVTYGRGHKTDILEVEHADCGGEESATFDRSEWDGWLAVDIEGGKENG